MVRADTQSLVRLDGVEIDHLKIDDLVLSAVLHHPEVVDCEIAHRSAVLVDHVDRHLDLEHGLASLEGLERFARESGGARQRSEQNAKGRGLDCRPPSKNSSSENC